MKQAQVLTAIYTSPALTSSSAENSQGSMLGLATMCKAEVSCFLLSSSRVCFFLAHAVRARGSDGHPNVCDWSTILKLSKKGNTIKCSKQGFAQIAQASLLTTHKDVPSWNKSNELDEWQCHSGTKRWNNKNCQAASETSRPLRFLSELHLNEIAMYPR